MRETKVRRIFESYQCLATDFSITPIVSGHINTTYKIKNNGRDYILQQLNAQVFPNLSGITQNIQVIADTLQAQEYPHAILSPLSFKNGSFLYEDTWRIFPFFANTQSFEKVISAEQTYRASAFLSEFHRCLLQLDPSKIVDSIPGFVDFEKRLIDFENSLKNAKAERLEMAAGEIKFLKENKFLVRDWLKILPKFPKRIIHGDPKISNFLFDQEDANKIRALIDWDTFMKGPILYDFGDMVRSYTNLKDEDNPTGGRIFSVENYKALKKGFLEGLEDWLTKVEIENMDLAGKVVIYVQATRFLTDFLQNDIYFSTDRPLHNLDRARNQIHLLDNMQG